MPAICLTNYCERLFMLARAFAVLCLTLSIVACSSGDPKFSDALNQYEAVVAEYEKVANKDTLCMSDVNNLNASVLPKIQLMGNDINAMKQSGIKPSEAQIKRYTEITQRFQAAMMKLSTKGSTIQMSC